MQHNNAPRVREAVAEYRDWLMAELEAKVGRFEVDLDRRIPPYARYMLADNPAEINDPEWIREHADEVLEKWRESWSR